jgi:TRAP-type C4-dicarboxylate transport system substrate-binding protein
MLNQKSKFYNLCRLSLAKKKRGLLVLAGSLLIVTLLVLPFGSFPVSEAAGKTVTLKAVTAFPWKPGPIGNFNQAFDWIEKVQKRANGELKIQYLGGPEVIPSFEQYEAARKGIVDIYIGPSDYAVPIMPESLAPVAVKLSPNKLRKTGFYALLGEIFQKHGLYFLGNVKSPAGYQLQTNIMVKRPEDLSGLKMRMSPVYKPFAAALGINYVSLPSGEVYTALERGLVDGFAWTVSSRVLDANWPEVCKYYIDHRFGDSDLVMLVSLDTWNKVPKKLQDLMQQTMIELEQEWNPVWAKHQEKTLELYKKAGMKPIRFSPADATRFVELYYDATWKHIMKKSPELGSKLEKLSKK